MRLPFNTNFHHISHRRLLFKFGSKDGHFAFLSPFGGLEKTHAVHLRLIGKLLVNLVLVTTFSLGIRLQLRCYMRISNASRHFCRGLGCLAENFR